MRVLVIDPSEEVRDLLKYAFNTTGVTCHTARTASEALKYSWRIAYNVAFTALSVPGMKGPMLARQLRKRYPSIRIYGMGDSLQIEAYQNDLSVFDGVYSKPDGILTILRKYCLPKSDKRMRPHALTAMASSRPVSLPASSRTTPSPYDRPIPLPA